MITFYLSDIKEVSIVSLGGGGKWVVSLYREIGNFLASTQLNVIDNFFLFKACASSFA